MFHIFCHDVWFYLAHVVLHHPRVYKIHKIHHSTSHSDLTYTDTYQGHWIEHIVEPMGILIPYMVPKAQVAPLLTAFVIISVRGLMRHDHRFTWLIGNHHLLHHKYSKYNFGEYWIDSFCGTVYPGREEYSVGLVYL